MSVGGVQIGGGAPVVVQTMTKTETANLGATMEQIRKVADAGADLVRVAVPRDKDIEALKTIVVESPIPVIADIHFNHTLALKAIDAGAHCIRLNPGNIGGPEKVAEVAGRARAAGTPMRIGVNSGSLPKHLHELERENPVEALVTAAVEFVGLMERLQFEDFKVSIKSTNVPYTIAANRLLSERIPYPLHLGITEAGTKWSGSLKSAVGLGTLLADGIGDTIRISLSTFHAEEEVKVAWEILKALKLRERGPVLIACPTCGRLQFDMDTVVADIERRLEAYEDPIEVAVLGCAVNGIGEASHADFGITGAKNEGLIFSRGKALKKVPQERLVDELFLEIDKYAQTKRIDVDADQQAAGAEWLQRIEEENAGELTPERLAKLEAESARADADAMDDVLLDERRRPPRGDASLAREQREPRAPGLRARRPRRLDAVNGGIQRGTGGSALPVVVFGRGRCAFRPLRAPPARDVDVLLLWCAFRPPREASRGEVDEMLPRSRLHEAQRGRSLPLNAAVGTQAAQRRDETTRPTSSARHGVPVDDVPPRVDVVRALVLVLEVVGVLPDVDAEQRRLAAGERRVLVGAADHGEAGAVVDEPGPAGAELVDAGLLQRALEVRERAERGVDRVGQGAARLAAAVGAHPGPEERVVVVAAAVVADGLLLVRRQRVEVLEDLLDRLAVPVRALERRVDLVHVGLVMLVVMHAHGRFVDVRLERVVRVGQGGNLVGHVSTPVGRRQSETD